MKIEKVPDGFVEIEQYVWTTLELVNSPEEHREFMQELKRSDDPYYFLGKLRNGCEEKLKKLSDSDDKKDKRARRDLRVLHESIEACVAAMRKREWKRAVGIAINVGGLGQKAKLRLQLEGEVLTGREAKKLGGPAAAKARRAGRARENDEDRPKYQKPMLELRKEGVKYGQAAFVIEREFREKKGDRHHATRIRELAPNPIPR